MNVNTLYFRAALTIAAMWIATFAYLTYSDYREAYRSTEYAGYAVPEEEEYKCTSTVLDGTKPGFQFREQTNDEKSECYRAATKEYVRTIESGNQFALEQAWKSFCWKGALPPLLLLAVVAFWSLISTAVGSAVSGYLNWLRFGSIKPDAAGRDDES